MERDLGFEVSGRALDI